MIAFMPEKQQANFRLSPTTTRRLAKLALRLGKSKTDVLETAVVHLLGTLERDQAVWMTVPSEPQTEFQEDAG